MKISRLPTFLFALLLSLPAQSVCAQDTVTGAFEGAVTNSVTGDPVGGAQVEIINLETGIIILKTTDARGRFYQGLLRPGDYRIKISTPGFQPREVIQQLKIAKTGEVVPVPVTLDPLTALITAPPPAPDATAIRAEINTRDASRSGSFNEVVVNLLPLGGATLTRSFDELALLLPGVAPPPQTLGTVAGPGQGSGVGTSGQFSVNGLRSRANNFTVDGSDNNDEDIGVRRQGFVALVPQPIESIREYQAITLLAPAQFGRNLGAQIIAVSKSGGNDVHGSVYGFFNSSQLNARNEFLDTKAGEATIPLLSASGQPVLLDGQPLRVVRDQSGGENSFTLGKFGGVVGGALRREKTFYFFSGEGQIINAVQEESFQTPTVEERGAFGSGATGIFQNPVTGVPTQSLPSNDNGSNIFSLFPFPNNPLGVYAANTFTQVLPASARGAVFSAKLDEHFKLAEREQSITARYNFTDDWRQIPTTGEAIFSTLRPEVRAQNFSLFFNSALSAPKAASEIFNQARLSYGRTRLRFEEVRDREFLLPSARFADIPFVLNARVIRSTTQPPAPGQPNLGPVTYVSATSSLETLAPLGQVRVAGFSPVGVDVFNFPQRRVNNTYQVADILTWRAGDHGLTFGADLRRSELNSDLPRLQRPLATFGGGQRFVLENGALRPALVNEPNSFIRPEDLAALGAASNFFLTLSNGANAGDIGLRYYQLNFFAQDDWRPRSDLSFSFGLRYEHNTPPNERRNLIERTFNDPALDLIRCSPGTPPERCGFRPFLAGRDRIFDPDNDDFAPRVSAAYTRQLFGKDRVTVFRAGYGLFYDQIIGAVVSQSRNVFPNFVTVNFGGNPAFPDVNPFSFFNPATTSIGGVRLVQANTLNRLNLPLNQQSLDVLTQRFPNALSLTLPDRRLPTPKAHHYSFSIEQQLSQRLTFSLAYVGTAGRNLLRLTTPNLGPDSTLALTDYTTLFLGGLFRPQSFGRVNTPARPVSGVGAVYLFAANAASRYDSLQAQMRGRLSARLQFDFSYTLSRAEDDVSDTFDLAGAFALPQNSLTLSGERGPANFDARHRVVYQAFFDLSSLGGRQSHWRWLTDGLRLTGVGRYQTGQPFTINSVIDVNLDGNLTDRLNTVDGIIATGDPQFPLRLAATDPRSLLAPFGQDGRIGRNTFRAGAVLETNLSVNKGFSLRGQTQVDLRIDIFNLFNRDNFGIPERLLEARGFGRAGRTVTPNQRIQLGLKLNF